MEVRQLSQSGSSRRGWSCGSEEAWRRQAPGVAVLIKLGLTLQIGSSTRLTVSLVICPCLSKSKGQIVSSSLPLYEQISEHEYGFPIYPESLSPSGSLTWPTKVSDRAISIQELIWGTHTTMPGIRNPQRASRGIARHQPIHGRHHISPRRLK